MLLCVSLSKRYLADMLGSWQTYICINRWSKENCFISFLIVVEMVGSVGRSNFWIQRNRLSLREKLRISGHCLYGQNRNLSECNFQKLLSWDKWYAYLNHFNYGGMKQNGDKRVGLASNWKHSAWGLQVFLESKPRHKSHRVHSVKIQM